jgi:hypothetical protein
MGAFQFFIHKDLHLFESAVLSEAKLGEGNCRTSRRASASRDVSALRDHFFALVLFEVKYNSRSNVSVLESGENLVDGG